MKNLSIFLLIFCTTLSFAQSDDILIQNEREDDTYLAGEKITVNAAINGDLIAAGQELFINDRINGDLTAAGASITISKNVADDVRLAAGKIIVDSEIEDDLVVFGGEVHITDKAIIKGNLICYANEIEMEGKVLGNLDVKGTKATINGEIHETSKIASEKIEIGPQAKFLKDVEYWSGDGEINFEGSLLNATAQFNEELEEENSPFSVLALGIKSFKAWIFYTLSVLLVLLVLHGLFRNAFSDAVDDLEKNYLKSFGFGLIYLIGVPLVIAIAFIVGVGMPLGLFMTGIFIFTVLIGHFVSSLLIVYYINHKKEMKWSFWIITLLALLVTIILRLLANIPFVGIALSIIILTIAYGALTLKAIQARKLST